MADMSQTSQNSGASKALYLWPKGADVAPTKAAVLDAKLPFTVRPFWFEPGLHDRCIALDTGFPFIGAEHVQPKTHANMVMSVQWFFGLIDLPKVHTTLSKLESVFGEGVKEIECDPWASDTSWTNPPAISKDGSWWIP